MTAKFRGDLRLRVIWFVHVLQHSVAETSFFLGVSEWTVEHYISKFLVTGDVKSQTAVHTRQRGTFFNWKKREFLLSSESRNLRETFIVGVDFYARWTQLMKFCIWNSVTTVPFGRPTSVRHSPFTILSDHFFWNSCIYTYSEKLQQFRKVLRVVLSSLFLKEIWKNGRKRHGRMFASAKGKRQKGKCKMQTADWLRAIVFRVRKQWHYCCHVLIRMVKIIVRSLQK